MLRRYALPILLIGVVAFSAIAAVGSFSGTQQANNSNSQTTSSLGSVTTSTTAQTSGLTIDEIQPNPPGNDQQNIEEEYIVFKNSGTSSINISGYTVKYSQSKAYTFTGSQYRTVIPVGQTVILKTSLPTNTMTVDMAQYEFSAGSDEPALSNSGGTITVTDSDGHVVLNTTYSAQKSLRTFLNHSSDNRPAR
jgi:hypothetical protein